MEVVMALLVLGAVFLMLFGIIKNIESYGGKK
jgi:hypothetical protein